MARTKAFNRDKVLDKAMFLFWQKGYHATTMENLVSHLGINRASIYDTYGSKRDLFDKALNRYREQKYTRVAGILHQHQEVRKGFYRLFEFFVESAIDGDDAKGCLLVNATTELAIADLYVQQKIASNQAVYEKLYVKYLEYGIKNKQLSEGLDLKSIASFFYTLQCGLEVAAKVQSSKEDLMAQVNMGLKLLQ